MNFENHLVCFHANLIYGTTISLQTKFSLSAESPVLADRGSLKWLIGIYCHISCKEESKVIKVILKVFIIEQFIVRPVLGPGQEVTRCSGNTVGDKCGACQQYWGHVHSQHNIFGIETLNTAGSGTRRMCHASPRLPRLDRPQPPRQPPDLHSALRPDAQVSLGPRANNSSVVLRIIL